MKNKEQIQVIGLRELNVIDWLKVHIPDMQLTGSISLHAYKVGIERPISDIDIVTFNPAFAEALVADEGIKTNEFTESEVVGEAMENKTISVRIEKDGVYIDCFISDYPQIYKEFTFIGGRKFKVSHPKYSIIAKRNYIITLMKLQELSEFRCNKITKHTKDIMLYNKWLRNQKGIRF